VVAGAEEEAGPVETAAAVALVVLAAAIPVAVERAAAGKEMLYEKGPGRFPGPFTFIRMLFCLRSLLS
jgi:hypothetical protein